MLNKFKEMKKTQYFIFYTVFFFILVDMFFVAFRSNDISFVWFSDGWNQHIKAYMYYSHWLRKIVKTLLFEHRFIIPKWDYNMGFGADIISTINYYVLGEPLTLLTIFFKQKDMYLLYNFLVPFRLYLAGLTFSYYCFYKKIENRLGILAASMIYIFSSYPLILGLHHPFFLIPMIMLPLWLTGFEKILNDESPVLFILSVFISLVSNFYFFYMTFLLCLIYALFRLAGYIRETNIKTAGIQVLKTIGFGTVGVMIGLVIFLPVLYLFMHGSRADITRTYPLFYDAEFCRSLFTEFYKIIDFSNHTCLGYPWLVVLCIICLIFIRKYRDVKIAFLLLTLCLVSPIAGLVFNGFSYASNRWCFGYSFLICLIVALVFNTVLDPKKPFYILKTMAAVVLVLVAFVEMNNNINATYVTDARTEEFLLNEDINERIEKTPDIIFANHKGLMRYSATKDIVKRNTNILFDVPSTNYYWSLNDGIFQEAFDAFSINSASYNYREFDGRTVLNAISSVNYFVTPGTNKWATYVPFAYKKKKSFRKKKDYPKFIIYKNKLALPFGYTYDSALDQKDFAKLNSVEKENALLYGVVTEGNVPLKKYDYKPSDISVPYTLTTDPAIKVKGDVYEVNEPEHTIDLSFRGLPDCETYLSLDIEFKSLDGTLLIEPVTIDAVSEGEKGTVTKWFAVFCKNSIRYENKDHFVVNTGRDRKKSISLKFNAPGYYKIKNIEVLCQPLAEYKASVLKLKEDVLHNVSLETNRFSGEINLDSSKFLLVPVAHSNGWKATVDGKPAEIYRAQKLFMGIQVPKGKHIIQFKYETPLLKWGFLISILGQLILLAIILQNFLTFKKMKGRKKKA